MHNFACITTNVYHQYLQTKRDKYFLFICNHTSNCSSGAERIVSVSSQIQKLYWYCTGWYQYNSHIHTHTQSHSSTNSPSTSKPTRPMFTQYWSIRQYCWCVAPSWELSIEGWWSQQKASPTCKLCPLKSLLFSSPSSSLLYVDALTPIQCVPWQEWVQISYVPQFWVVQLCSGLYTAPSTLYSLVLVSIITL